MSKIQTKKVVVFILPPKLITIILLFYDFPQEAHFRPQISSNGPSSFPYFLFLVQRGPSKVCIVGNFQMWNQIMHPMISSDRNLSKNTGIYVENTNTKSSFFLFSSKINKYYFIILTIILLFSLGGPFQTSKFL